MENFNIEIRKSQSGINVVDARVLYSIFEGRPDNYTRWIKKFISDYGFVLGQDFFVTIYDLVDKKLLVKKDESDNQQVTNGHFRTDYWLTIDCAKELAMVQKSEKGHQVRQWFIEKEKELRQLQSKPSYQIEDSIERAQAWIAEEKERRRLLSENIEMKPKAEYYDEVLDTTNAVKISIIAKELEMTAIALNKKLHELHVQFKQGSNWVLYKEYQDKGYTLTRTTVVNDKSFHDTLWTEKGRKFIHELLKK